MPFARPILIIHKDDPVLVVDMQSRCVIAPQGHSQRRRVEAGGIGQIAHLRQQIIWLKQPFLSGVAYESAAGLWR